jgi:hypothetical protein
MFASLLCNRTRLSQDRLLSAQGAQTKPPILPPTLKIHLLILSPLNLLLVKLLLPQQQHHQHLLTLNLKLLKSLVPV